LLWTLSPSTSGQLTLSISGYYELAVTGKDMAQTLSELAEVRRRMRILFVVDTLDYLARGGRISQLSKRLGNLLQLKPLLHLDDGRIALLDKVRTKPKAVQHMLNIFTKEAHRAQQVAVVHIDALEEGQALLQRVQEHYSGAVTLYQCGAVIGSHAGPGTVGLCWY